MLTLEENSSFTWNAHLAVAHLHRGLTECFMLCETDCPLWLLRAINKGNLGDVEVITFVYQGKFSGGTHTHTHSRVCMAFTLMASCCYSEASLVVHIPSSHLFSSHRQHAVALLHSDWLVLGPRAERSGTQAAEQVESQDRRGPRSLQGQTGVRPGRTRPPLELTQPANQLPRALSTAQSSGGWIWASNLRPTLKVHLRAPQRLQVQPEVDDLRSDLLVLNKPRHGKEKENAHSILVWAKSSWKKYVRLHGVVFWPNKPMG